MKNGKTRRRCWWLALCMAAGMVVGCADDGDLLPPSVSYPIDVSDTLAYKADTLAVRAILDSNGLTAISGEAVTSVDSSRITVLDLRGYAITTIPAEIGRLTRLQELKLGNTGVASLPPQVGLLTSLTYLDLIRTGIRALPPEICRCISLQSLYLTNDTLPYLPDSIGQLQSLTRLELANNDLTALPASIMTIPGLSSVSVLNNRLCAVPADMSVWLNTNAQERSGWRNSQRCVP